MTAKISIVVAAHNEGDSLWKTVRSCIETCGHLEPEIIIADDASTDGSVDEAAKRYPQVRVVRHAERLGPSPTKHLGATAAAGDVLVFLDGHCKPEAGAIERLVDDVQLFEGQAIVTPTVPMLDVETWENGQGGGHGYQLWLDALEHDWMPLHQMRRFRREIRGEDRTFYESPALIGCAFAIRRDLYQKLGGFDVNMRSWGVEDLDFGLTCWLMGHKIVHDPFPRIGHRFQRTLDRYTVPAEHLLANQFAMARKHLGDDLWDQWLNHCRSRVGPHVSDRRNALWQAAWAMFASQRLALEQRRFELRSRRVHDEFWYAKRFWLDWPARGAQLSLAAASDPWTLSASPSPSPPPCDQCKIEIEVDADPIEGEKATVLIGHHITVSLVCPFNAKEIEWTIPPKTFKQYNASNQKRELVLLKEEDLKRSWVSFHWADAGDNRVVTVRFKAPNGDRCQKAVTFDVKEPTLTQLFPPDLNEVVIWNPDDDAARRVGPRSEAGDRGIEFLVGVSTPQPFAAGTIQFVQVVQGSLNVKKNDDTCATENTYPDDQFLLDNSYPYGNVAFPADNTPARMNDSPSVILPAHALAVEQWGRNDYKMYLMFRPPGQFSAYVSLAWVQWWWKYKAVKNANWQLTDPEPRQGTGNWARTTEHPLWTARYVNQAQFSWKDVECPP